MIRGGIVFRIVTHKHPGEPTLDDPSVSIQFRKEYVCFDAPGWTPDRALAHVYATYAVAEAEAKARGERCHAGVASPPEDEIPERLRPVETLQVLPPPVAYPSKKKQRKVRAFSTVLAASAEQRRDWVKEIYG